VIAGAEAAGEGKINAPPDLDNHRVKERK
jgi:hypothetical protein